MLITNGFSKAAVRADLDAWITTYNLTISCFIGGTAGTFGPVTAANRETTVIVQLPSMKVVNAYPGDQTGSTPSGINVATTQMHTLLGK